MSIRKDWKSFIYDNGKQNYDFDYSEELVIYKFLCGERITRKQYIKLEKNKELIFTYVDWEKRIKEKYSCYYIDILKEFSRYLNHRLRMNSPQKEYINSVLSAVVASIIAGVLSQQSEILAGIGVSIYGFILELVVAVSMGIAGTYFVTKMLLGIFDDYTTKENFFRDYKEIVDNIIKEK